MFSITSAPNRQNNLYQQNNTLNFSSRKVPVNMYEQISHTVDKLSLSVEKEVPAEGFFTKIVKHFINEDSSVYADKVSLSVSAAESKLVKNHEKIRFLDVTVQDPGDKLNTISENVSIGTKKDILKKLHDRKSVQSIKRQVQEIAKRLQFPD